MWYAQTPLIFHWGCYDTNQSTRVRYANKKIRWQGIFDIETSDFDPKRGFIICYYFIRRNVFTDEIEYYADAITKKDIKDSVHNLKFEFDKRVLVNLSQLIKSCDQVIGHYSTKFDMPFFRSRCGITGQPHLVPNYDEVHYGDTWRMVKNGMKMPRNTLENTIMYLNQKNQKTHVDMKHWNTVWFPENNEWSKSMGYITDHCKKDVHMTLKVLKILEDWNPIQKYKL